MVFEDGEIIPNVGIGKIALGMPFGSIQGLLKDSDYTLQYRGNGIRVVTLENAMLFFDREGRLFQIGVTTGFKGRFDGTIHVGCKLKVLICKYGKVYEEYDNYLIEGIRGISFELEDSENEDSAWNPEDIPIEWIFVFQDI